MQGKADSEQINETRRSFFTATALVAATSVLKAQEKKVDGTLDYFDLVDVKESVNEVVIYLEEKNSCSVIITSTVALTVSM